MQRCSEMPGGALETGRHADWEHAHSVRGLQKRQAQARQAGVKSCLGFSLREGHNSGHIICYRMIWGTSLECPWAPGPSFSKDVR